MIYGEMMVDEHARAVVGTAGRSWPKISLKMFLTMDVWPMRFWERTCWPDKL